jgi:hypothetical protein
VSPPPPPSRPTPDEAPLSQDGPDGPRRSAEWDVVAPPGPAMLAPVRPVPHAPEESAHVLAAAHAVSSDAPAPANGAAVDVADTRTAAAAGRAAAFAAAVASVAGPSDAAAEGSKVWRPLIRRAVAVAFSCATAVQVR